MDKKMKIHVQSIPVASGLTMLPFISPDSRESVLPFFQECGLAREREGQ